MLPQLVVRTAFLCLALATGCTAVPTPEQLPTRHATSRPASATSPFPVLVSPSPLPEVSSAPGDSTVLGLTNQRPDGNRWLSGLGDLPVEPLDIPLAGRPLWLVAAPLRGGSLWVVALADGQVQAFQIEGGEVSELVLNLSTLPAGMPPALQVTGDHVELLEPAPEASTLTSPLPLGDGSLAYIDLQGQLHLTHQGETRILALKALPDARLLTDGAGRMLFLSGPSGQYSHGVLGDQLEATTITLVDTTADPPASQVIGIDSRDVIEGLAPIWEDLDGDGQRDILVTQSNAEQGARLVAYHEDGSRLASGDPIGQGFRWRHQLAVAQFIPGGPMEIAAVRTPHIGGIAEIYTLEGDRLVVQASLAGYSSHQLGSRNLDRALVADFNGDGQAELVVPDQSRMRLAGLQVAGAGLETVWEALLGGVLGTNLAALSLPDGGLALGVGLESARLRLWLPK